MAAQGHVTGWWWGQRQPDNTHPRLTRASLFRAGRERPLCWRRALSPCTPCHLQPDPGGVTPGGPAQLVPPMPAAATPLQQREGGQAPMSPPQSPPRLPGNRGIQQQPLGGSRAQFRRPTPATSPRPRPPALARGEPRALRAPVGGWRWLETGANPRPGSSLPLSGSSGQAGSAAAQTPDPAPVSSAPGLTGIARRSLLLCAQPCRRAPSGSSVPGLALPERARGGPGSPTARGPLVLH